VILDTYFFSIWTAFLFFPVIAAVLTLPYLIYCYRKYGSISVLRTLILFSMLFCLQCAYFLVVLPLPDPATVVDKTGPFTQLIPFSFVRDFIVESGFVLTQPSTWLLALKSNTLLQPIFNLLLTAPFGAYLCYYFKKDLRKVILFSFLLSLFFELTQLSGLYGLYAHPYRLFDVDDLILNTLGGVLGYWFAVHVLRFLPSRDRIDEKSRERSIHVGYTRRLLAFFIDALVISLLELLLFSLPAFNDFTSFALALCVYSIGVPALFHGSTIGKALVRIRIEGVETSRPLFWLLLVRYLIRNAVILSLNAVSNLTLSFDYPYQLIVDLFPLVLLTFILLDTAWSLRKDRRLLYERISKTRNVSTFEVTPSP
jgi:glycopeptide antibiotics resistance protein